jgi:MFS family permease
MTTDFSISGDNRPTMYKTHEGEHHGDWSDSSVKITRSTYIFAAVAAVNSCNLGYDIGVSTNAGALIQQDFNLSDAQRELFIGFLNLWSIFGSLFAHSICDRYGRRRSFVVAAISFIIGVVAMAFAGSYAILMIGRAFVGLGVGFGLAVSCHGRPGMDRKAAFFLLDCTLFLYRQIDPLYIAEISPAAHRGELVTWSELALNVGIVLGFASGLIFYDLDDSVEWRVMFLMGAILPVVMLLLVWTVMPESPRWLVGKGREEEAKSILQRVYPNGFDIDSVVQDIKEALEREKEAEMAVGWNIILSPSPAIRRMLIVGIGTAVAQQAVGIDAIQYYLIDVLKESGIESEKGRLGILILLGVLKLTFVFVGGKLFDRKGRRPLLFVSLVGTY